RVHRGPRGQSGGRRHHHRDGAGPRLRRHGRRPAATDPDRVRALHRLRRHLVLPVLLCLRRRRAHQLRPGSVNMLGQPAPVPARPPGWGGVPPPPVGASPPAPRPPGCLPPPHAPPPPLGGAGFASRPPGLFVLPLRPPPPGGPPAQEPPPPPPPPPPCPPQGS